MRSPLGFPHACLGPVLPQQPVSHRLLITQSEEAPGWGPWTCLWLALLRAASWPILLPRACDWLAGWLVEDPQHGWPYLPRRLSLYGHSWRLLILWQAHVSLFSCRLVSKVKTMTALSNVNLISPFLILQAMLWS